MRSQPLLRAQPHKGCLEIPSASYSADTKQAPGSDRLLPVCSLKALPGAVESQIASPATRQNFAIDRCAGREHLSQLGRGRCRGSENVVIDNRAVGAVDAATTDKAMIDAVVEVARMMLGGDEVDAVAIVRGIFQS